MQSRVREGRNKLIDAFAKLDRHDNNDPVVWCYPPDGLDEELRRSVPRFAFPFQDGFQSSNIDYFTFVLTAIDGKFRFGFCRMSAGSESTFCLISSYPWFEIFYKILNHLSDAQNSPERLRSLLDDLSEVDPSIPGKKFLTFKVPPNQTSVTFDYPNPNKLPSIPESRNLTEYYNAIDGYNMIIIFASMLFERRIIITSRKLSRLTACVYGATSLIYPLNWQHIFIPVLPAHLLDYLSAPMPYLIGVHSSLLGSVGSTELDDAVIVDADKSQVQSVHEDLESLPSSIVKTLKKSLNIHPKDKHCSLTGDRLSKAFLNAMVSLIGGYRAALVERDGRVAFDRVMFEQSRGSSMQPFLQKILQSQSFERFVEERVTFAKYRKGLSDVFEEAIEESNAKHKGSVKKKMMKPDKKMLSDLSKKMRKTSAHAINSVTKRLVQKKTYEDFYGEGRAVQYQEEEVTQVVAPGSKPLVIQLSEEAVDKQITLVVSPGSDLPDTPPSILRHQRQTSRNSTINRRHSFMMSKADEDDVEQMMEMARKNGLKNSSADDLTNRAVDDDAVTLSSCSIESGDNSEMLPISDDNQNQVITNLPSVQTEARRAKGVAGIFAKLYPGVTGHPESGSEYSDEGHCEDDNIGNIKTKAKAATFNRGNTDPVPEFPSVSQLKRALQRDKSVHRKAVISVQELPNVRQIVQRFEATSEPQKVSRSHDMPPHTTTCRSQDVVTTVPSRPPVRTKLQDVVLVAPCKSSETVVTTTPCKSKVELSANTGSDNDSSFELHQAAVYSSLDRKARSSLSRKQAIRVTGPRIRKPSSSDSVDGGEADVTEKVDNPSSYLRKNSGRYLDVLDMVKTERNSAFLEVNNPYEHDFGCLLRVSTKSASMRQLNLIEQRNSGSLKRSLPVSNAARDNMQRVRTAIYDPPDVETETKTDAQNNSKKSSCRNALYVSFQPKSESETVEVESVEVAVSDNRAIEVTTGVVDHAEHPNEFARSLDYEILSLEGSTSAQSPEFNNWERSYKQSWSFDGVIVERRDVLATPPPLPNGKTFPGQPSIPSSNRETLGSSSDEEDSSDSSAVFDDPDCGVSLLSSRILTLEQEGHNAVPVESSDA